MLWESIAEEVGPQSCRLARQLLAAKDDEERTNLIEDTFAKKATSTLVVTAPLE